MFSIFKRAMVGIYQHCGEAHLHRYLAEFDFRKNRRTAFKISDAERAEDLLRALAASASPIEALTKPRTLKQKARRLQQKRKKRHT